MKNCLDHDVGTALTNKGHSPLIVSYGIRHFHLTNDEMGENFQTLQEERERPEYQRDLECGNLLTFVPGSN